MADLIRANMARALLGVTAWNFRQLREAGTLRPVYLPKILFHVEQRQCKSAKCKVESQRRAGRGRRAGMMEPFYNRADVERIKEKMERGA